MTFRRLVQKLRREAPPLLPVRVYERDAVGDNLWGLTSLMVDHRNKPLRFVILVRKSSPTMMADTLMHEWAHALTWHEGTHAPTDHGDQWALAFGRCYRILIEP